MANAPGKRMIDSGDAARYIATIASELASLARQNGLDTLGHLLDMARLEAEGATGTIRRPKQSGSASA
jgi:hypothetical protein